MFVYRIENEFGVGPYRNDLKFSQNLNYSHQDENHPSIRNDFGYWPKDEYFCGFKDVDQYNEWFSDQWKIIMKENNFKLVKYSISKTLVKLGRKQVVFYKSKARKISEFELI